jgi:protein-tyrosine phosphatase
VFYESQNFNGLLRKHLSVPLAEGILKSKLPTDKFIVDSAGTGSGIGHHQTLALQWQKTILISSAKGTTV